MAILHKNPGTRRVDKGLVCIHIIDIYWIYALALNEANWSREAAASIGVERTSDVFIREGAMCHLLLSAPLLGLILFYFFPWKIASVPYIIIVIGSFFIYWKVMLSQRRRPATGKRGMIGDHAVVLKISEGPAEVRYHGEIWRAKSAEPLTVGQRVIIQDVEGLTLKVSPLSSERQQQDQAGADESK